jgi:hypothetical protein
MAEGGRFFNASETLYDIISSMKHHITMSVGIALGGGVQLPPALIDRYSNIIRSNIEYHKEVMPQRMFQLLEEIIALSQRAGLPKRKLDQLRAIKNRFYAGYTLELSKLTQNEGHAAAPQFMVEPTIAEPGLGIMNAINMEYLPHPPARIIHPVQYDPTYGPLVTKKSKSRRRTKSAGHVSKTRNSRRKRSAP